ncbi:MAG: threonine ammonia-lyase [Fusobacteriaceae bacterium]
MEKDVTLESIEEARKKIGKYIRNTPLFDAPILSKMTGNNIYVKFENLQKTGSFKLRGALNKILNLTDEEKKRGVIAASAGNHAQGVALGAELFGIKATIVMPESAPLPKISATKSYGAEIVLHGAIFDDAFAKAQELQKETGLVFLHPFDDADVISGQGTIGLEILEQLENIDIILIPIGGGGMIAGIAKAIKSKKPSVKVIGVQTDNVPSMEEALKVGMPVEIKAKPTIADGIAVRKAGVQTYKLIKENVDDVITVSEDEIANAILFSIENGKTVAEGAGAVALAAILAGKIKEKGKNICAIISGGNIDINLMDRIINRGLFNSGRRFEFKVTLPDKIGELEKLLENLKQSCANILFMATPSMYSRNMMANIKKVRVVVECIDQAHQEVVKKSLLDNGYIFED